jgi:multiple sugar transport system substrate-binding protein
MRRTITASTVAGLLLAALVAGCGPGSTSAGGPVPLAGSETGPITFAVGKDDVSFFQKLVSWWNQSHPARDQRVTLLQLPETANEQLAQLAANLQAKSPLYDVIDMDVVWTAEFASAGWVIPLDGSKLPLTSFLPPAVRTAMYGSRLYAVPFYSNAELLYYRSDLLSRAHAAPPATWAELARQASTIAPRYGLSGYAGQFAQYEGLTVNFATAVQSAGGSILSPGGTKVTVNSPQALTALNFLVSGLADGWIPKAALNYAEENSREAFESGHLLFLSNWPYVYSDLSSPGSGNLVYGKVKVAPLPGPSGPGSGSLGGADLAISSYSRHQRTGLAFIRWATSLAVQRRMFIESSFPPVWKSLYSDPGLKRRFPYLPVLEQAILAAQPRPAITDYDQASLIISSAVYQALTHQKSPQQALQEMAAQLTQIIHLRNKDGNSRS